MYLWNKVRKHCYYDTQHNKELAVKPKNRVLELSLGVPLSTYDKGIHRMRKTLLALLLLATAAVQAQVQLKDGHPDNYTVVKGDTLWDISGKFLSKPWKWPEIWHANPQVANPHLIYPGDRLSLVYVDGQPRIMLNRGASRGTIKLSPKVRSTPMAEAIPTIPLEAINSFLLSNRIVNTPEEFAKKPYVVAGNAERVISGAGDRIYVRGDVNENAIYGIFRQGRTYVDPVTEEFLGINADDIGGGEVVAIEEDIGTMILSRTTQEVRNADRLFPTEERAINSTFLPSEPKEAIEGVILDVPRGVSQIGQFDVVTINKGARDGLVEGNVLAVYKTGETVRDNIGGDSVKIPDERSGLLMVFRTYDKLSYGLVLYASRQLAVMDKVKNP
jgi:nucleoid-associated protein YgaU